MGLTIPGCSNLWRRWGGSLAAEGDGGLACELEILNLVNYKV